LTFSPNEESSAGDLRLPGALRQALAALRYPIDVFNPRGQPLRQVPSVELLCGLMLECLDPGQTHETALRTLTRASRTAFNRWRGRARDYIALRTTPTSLGIYVRTFAARTGRWPREIGLSDLTYKLVTWIPAMQDDPEGLCHLEVVQRSIIEAARFTGFGGTVVFEPGLEEASIKEALRSVFASLAEGAIEVDEDLLETLPSDRLNILSIHQAKGLQFPLIMVDVGSAFSRPHWRQAMFRYPLDGNDAHKLEDELRPHSRTLRAPARPALDRAFDDLIRTYFVAFSRAQDVLLLVGNSRLLTDTPSPIPNVATGWDRDGAWGWGVGLPNLQHL
jgi:DNA helicase II / ATP-dependent DNA helicase PcrA